MTSVALKELRNTRGETQQEFAEHLNRGLDRSYDGAMVSKWENGAKSIPGIVAVFLTKARAKLPAPPGPAAVPGSTRIIAIANQKGGVGKTATAVNVAYALAKAGFATLIIDLDPQANATTHMGLDPAALEDAEATLYHALLGGRTLADIIVPVSDDVPLSIAPSSIRLTDADVELISEMGGQFILREQLDSIKAGYAFIVIDCPPHLGLLTVNALMAATEILVPCQTEVHSAMGIPQLLKHLEKVKRRGNPDLRICGILPTLFTKRNSQDVATLQDLHDVYDGQIRVFPPIPRATAYAQAAAAGRVTIEAIPNAAGAEVYRAIAAELIGAHHG
ncbi:MAG TPA: AAA family ATPase [Patescibacteria group bacterium]|nr:AAA family ATPase [Patescibacteria group bacterium]